jgi:hypothetical protein
MNAIPFVVDEIGNGSFVRWGNMMQSLEKTVYPINGMPYHGYIKHIFSLFLGWLFVAHKMLVYGLIILKVKVLLKRKFSKNSSATPFAQYCKTIHHGGVVL